MRNNIYNIGEKSVFTDKLIFQPLFYDHAHFSD